MVCVNEDCMTSQIGLEYGVHNEPSICFILEKAVPDSPSYTVVVLRCIVLQYIDGYDVLD